MARAKAKWCEREARVRADLKHSIRDGSAYSMMVGLGESYLAAFMLALGFSQLSSALITTLPLLAGSVLQLVSPFGVRRLNSYKRWVVCSACVQALSFLIFVLAAVNGRFPEWAIYTAASIYWGASLATGPAWNTWISTLVPVRIRTEFFSRRSRITYAFTLFGLMTGGIILHVGKSRGLEMQTFVGIFLTAALLRFASATFLALQSEPAWLARSIQVLSFGETFAKVRQNSYGRILTYLFFFQIAVHFASSFITPFMLKQLAQPYWMFMLLTGTMVLAKAIAMPYVPRLIKRFGVKKVLVFATLGIAPLPVGWLAPPSLEFFILLQIVSGIVWAAHELSVFLILFGEIPESDRTSVLTEFNLFHTVGVVTGSIAGGAIFNNMGQSYEGYVAIFAISSFSRLACVAMLPAVGTPFLKAGLRIYHRTLGVRPSGGGISRPIVTDKEAGEAKANAADRRLARELLSVLLRRIFTSRERRQKPEAPRSTHPTQ